MRFAKYNQQRIVQFTHNVQIISHIAVLRRCGQCTWRRVNCMATRVCLSRLRNRDAVGRLAARQFVQDAQHVETDFQAVARHFGRRERIP